MSDTTLEVGGVLGAVEEQRASSALGGGFASQPLTEGTRLACQFIGQDFVGTGLESVGSAAEQPDLVVDPGEGGVDVAVDVYGE